MDILINILSIDGEEKYKFKLQNNQINYYHLQMILDGIINGDNIYYLLDNDKIIYASFDDLNYNIIEINNNYINIIFIPIKLEYMQKLRDYNKYNLDHEYYSNFIDTYVIVKFAIRCCPSNLKYASENLRNNFDLVKIAVEKNGRVLEHASENLRSNFDIVKIAINNNSEAIKYASDNLRDKIEIIDLACKYSIQFLEYASINLQNNYYYMKNIFIKLIKNMNSQNYNNIIVNFLEKILSINVLLYQKVIDDYDMAMNIIKYNPHIIEYFSENIKNNYNIGLMAVTNDGACLKFLSKTLKEDKIIVRTAITQKFKSYTLQFAPKLQDDYDTVILAVMNEASSLKYASKRLREDYNIVKAAFNNNKTSLKHASKNIKHLFR